MSKDQNWENGSFEEFIRRSVEDPQLEFDPKAWEAMEEKLDAQAGGTGHAGHAGKIGAGLIALLVMSLLGWFLFSGTEEDTKAAAERQEQEQLSQPSGMNSGASVELDDQQLVSVAAEKQEHEPAQSGSARETGTTTAAGVNREHLSSRVNGADVKENSSASTAAKIEKGSPSGGADNTGKARAGIPGGVNAGAMNSSNLNNAGEEAGIKDNSSGAADATNEQGLQRVPWQEFVFDQGEIIPLRQAVAETGEEVVVPGRPKALPLSLSLSLAPDLSGMGKDVSTGLGAAAGLHLEYRVLPRLGLVTGLVYSQKNYLANSSYSLYGSGYPRPKPDYIDASCGVLDIPLNLRYYLFQGKQHNFFLSSGLSSYLMKREDYTLVYSNGQYKDYTYELRNENRHYFAVYNFSAGYENRLSPRWALQVEPFLKIPARGLGAGSLRLNSMGAFVHLKYSISRLGN